MDKLVNEMVPVGNAKRVRQLYDTFRQATVLEINFWESECLILWFFVRGFGGGGFWGGG